MSERKVKKGESITWFSEPRDSKLGRRLGSENGSERKKIKLNWWI